MKKIFLYGILIGLLGMYALPVRAQQRDSLPEYWLKPVTVTGTMVRWSIHEVPITRQEIAQVLQQAGVELIRRGVLFSSDVYLDGFKRGDVEITIDGERYPNSCPNRMDPPLARVNPLDVEAVLIDVRRAGNVSATNA